MAKRGRKAKDSDGFNKSQVIRETIDAMGGVHANPKPRQVQERIRSEHGVDVPANFISMIKMDMKRKAGIRGRSRGDAGGDLTLQDIERVKELVKALGGLENAEKAVQHMRGFGDLNKIERAIQHVRSVLSSFSE